MQESYIHLIEDTEEVAGAWLACSSIGLWSLALMHVPLRFQGKGIGTNLMKQICADADKENVTLILTPSAWNKGLLSQQQLIKWYEKYGFVDPYKTGIKMVRMPNKHLRIGN